MSSCERLKIIPALHIALKDTFLDILLGGIPFSQHKAEPLTSSHTVRQKRNKAGRVYQLSGASENHCASVDVVF
jgi:hypothetical protein